MNIVDCSPSLPMSLNQSQVIFKPNNDQINYQQKVFIRWLKPATPPPPAPIIIREIEERPQILPPLIYRQMCRSPPTPPPIVVREPPPPPSCPVEQPIVLEKRLPAVCPPRQVIVEQCPMVCPKPQRIISEKCCPIRCQSIARAVCIDEDSCPPPPSSLTCGRRCSIIRKPPIPCRRLVKEIIRTIPQAKCSVCVPRPPPPPPPARRVEQTLICSKEEKNEICRQPAQVVEQLIPVYATRQKIIQPKGIRVIRQVIGPAQFK